jgi:hypothetical protein
VKSTVDIETGRTLRDLGLDRTREANKIWFERGLECIRDLFPPGWIGIAEQWRFVIEDRIGSPMSEKTWGSLTAQAEKRGLIERTGRHGQMKDERSHARESPEWMRTNKKGWNMALFNVAERIAQVLAAKKKLEEMEDAFEQKVKPLEEWIEKARNELLEYLNETGQKSAATVNGTAYWKPKVTYKVTDKDEFRRHVIGTEAWELLTWAAAPTNCEAFTEANSAPPPGTERSAINILYVNQPPKPRKTKDVDDNTPEEPAA